MAFRQVARKPVAFEIDWGDRFDVLPWTEDKTEDIAQFLFGTGTRSFAELSECADGTIDSARHYVTRARKYVREELKGDEVGFAASSLVYDKTTRRLIAVCLSVLWLERLPYRGPSLTPAAGDRDSHAETGTHCPCKARQP